MLPIRKSVSYTHLMKPQADDTCLKCGTCAAKCPVQAIPPQRPWETDGEKCISCMRCLAICPAHARKLDADRQMCIRDRIVAAITGCRFKHPLPTHVALYHVEGLRYGSVVLLEQIRTIDASRLRDYIGRINREEMADIIKTVQSFVCNQNRSSGYVITLF